MQVDGWGLVEGGHDVDIADLRVQISSAAVFLGLILFLSIIVLRASFLASFSSLVVIDLDNFHASNAQDFVRICYGG